MRKPQTKSVTTGLARLDSDDTGSDESGGSGLPEVVSPAGDPDVAGFPLLHHTGQKTQHPNIAKPRERSWVRIKGSPL